MSKTLKITILSGVIIIILGLFAYNFIANDSSPDQPKTVGILYFRQHIDSYGGLKSGLAKLGYTDKDIKYNEILLTPGPNLDADIDNGVRKLLEDNVDILWVSLEHQALAAVNITKELNNDTPIVFTARFQDPLDFGIIESYKSSGNNSTGIATSLPLNVQKTLQFFREINPETKKVGVFSDGFMVPPNWGEAYLQELKKQASRFDMTVVEYKTNKEPDFTGEKFNEIASIIKQGDIDALFHIPVHFNDTQEVLETELAKRLHIPFSVPSEDLPTGGTFAYADDFAASAEQSAVMISKIFNGAKPSDIPIEFGAKQTLSLNLKRASEAGIVFPNSMLYIAEEKITE